MTAEGRVTQSRWLLAVEQTAKGCFLLAELRKRPPVASGFVFFFFAGQEQRRFRQKHPFLIAPLRTPGQLQQGERRQPPLPTERFVAAAGPSLLPLLLRGLQRAQRPRGSPAAPHRTAPGTPQPRSRRPPPRPKPRELRGERRRKLFYSCCKLALRVRKETSQLSLPASFRAGKWGV